MSKHLRAMTGWACAAMTGLVLMVLASTARADEFSDYRAAILEVSRANAIAGACTVLGYEVDAEAWQRRYEEVQAHGREQGVERFYAELLLSSELTRQGEIVHRELTAWTRHDNPDPARDIAALNELQAMMTLRCDQVAAAYPREVRKTPDTDDKRDKWFDDMRGLVLE